MPLARKVSRCHVHASRIPGLAKFCEARGWKRTQVAGRERVEVLRMMHARYDWPLVVRRGSPLEDHHEARGRSVPVVREYLRALWEERT